jgi:hypothetical protein
MYLIVDSNYPIYRDEIIADLPILEPIGVRFFDALLAVTGGYFPLRDLPNPVLGVEGRDRSRVVPVDWPHHISKRVHEFARSFLDRQRLFVEQMLAK